MLLIAFGTRPELLKCQPLINMLKKHRIKYKTLFTGQHEDLLKNIEFNYKLKIKNGENRLDSIVESVMNKKLLWKNITHVLVQGDTTSVLAVALAAFHRKIKVIHLEAGLRTYDNENPYPEEQNRRLVSQITDIHLCPTELSRANLENERILGEKYVVGNTVLDNLLEYKDKCEYSNKILITMHRRENHHWLDKWFIEIDKLAEKYSDYEFILPLHPNPNVQQHKNLLKNVNVVDPLPYDDLLNIMVKTKLIITDSGGIQEEASFFQKKCLTCRKFTERPEAVNKSTFLVERPENLSEIFDKYILDYEINYESPFGDGHSSEKIVKILKNTLYK
jgi:UDP-N-acetylglucosamine 2-epimerase (non-hydrolysing)